LLDKALNHENENIDSEEVLYWYYMQNFAKQRVSTFAKKLPAEAKAFVEPKLKKIEENIEELNSPDKVN
jgi:hypothetical protein